VGAGMALGTDDGGALDQGTEPLNAHPEMRRTTIRSETTLDMATTWIARVHCGHTATASR
jgi:hypothetical protein